MRVFRPRSRRRGPALVLALLLILTACTSTAPQTVSVTDGPSPDSALAQFVAAWQSGQPDSIASLTSNPAAARQELTTVIGNLAPTSIQVSASPLEGSGDTRTTTASMVWTLPKGVTWKYETSWTLAKASSGWPITWSPKVIHPKLGESQSVALRSSDTSAGALVDRNNQQLVEPVTVYSVVVLPNKIGDVSAAAKTLEKILKPYDPTATAASIVAGVRKSDPKVGYTVTNLRQDEYDAVKPELDKISGLAIPSTVRDLPPVKNFAKILLSEATPVASKLLTGEPGWRIVSIDATGAELETLAEQAAKPGPNVVLTIDVNLQKAAEAALADIPEPAMLVAIQPSTGEILAVAQNAPANAQGPLALMGQYPPGSTFKIVTATAGIDANLVTPDTEVDCPGEFTIDSRAIHNEGFELGTVTLTQAFAKSCNTTFAQLATRLPADALTKAATEYGIGRDFVIPGITTLTGKVPVADSSVQLAEDGFGQGVVLVTPFSAALMAATVANGNMPTPTLIRGTKTTIDQPAPSRSAAVQSGLRTLMRAVVTDGTATLLQQDGEVYAKTGTADTSSTANDAHAWTVGYRGDVAFSVLIVKGGSSKRSNAVVDQFLKAVPQG